MLNCGPGNTCCGSCTMQAPANLGGAWPRTEQVIADYLASQVEPGMGFFPALMAAVTSIASTVGATAVKLAPTIASVAGMQASAGGGAASGPTAEQIAAAVTPQVQAALAAQGVALPSSVVQQASAASILDAFGTQNRPYVMAAGLGLGALLLVTLLRK